MSYDIIKEDVPSFVKRIGDYSIQGSNNTLIVLGTDRAKDGPASVNDGILESGAGTIHIVTGRKTKDPDLREDKSYVYVSSKTKMDTNLRLTGVEKNSDGKAAVIVKSDTLRLVFRENVKIVSEDAKKYVYIDDKKVTVKIGNNIIEMDDSSLRAEVGSTKMKLDGTQIDLSNGGVDINATNALVKVTAPALKISGGCVTDWNTFFSQIASHIHATAVGPSSPSPQAAAGVVTLQSKFIG